MAGPTAGVHADRRALVERVIRLAGADDERAAFELYTEDAVVSWPQSGEIVRGAAACAAVAARQPGGRPTLEVLDVFGAGDRWVVISRIDYGSGKPWHALSVVDLEGDLVRRRTDYFAEAFDPPAWRSDLVELGDA